MALVQHRNPGETFAGYTQLVVEICCSCGVSFAMPEMLRARAIADHDRWFYCPNGHTQHFTGPTEAEQLRKQLEREKDRAARIAAERDQAAQARDEAKASARAEKAAKTRFKNERDGDRRRVAHGVCPCCGRTFKQLSLHMAAKHPDFVAEADREVGTR